MMMTIIIIININIFIIYFILGTSLHQQKEGIDRACDEILAAVIAEVIIEEIQGEAIKMVIRPILDELIVAAMTSEGKHILLKYLRELFTT